VLVLTHNVQPDTFRSQVSRLGTESFIPYGTHKLTEGTGQKSLLLWRNPMAKVTYRGVSYDTNDKKSCQKEATVLTYRGVKHTESKTVCA
jgi:hypothetical protein